jgi:undecaprenyl-diphosphatase
MDLWSAILLGIIQGLTEWLPVSSTAHLALAERTMDIRNPLFFDVMLHFGTLLAVVVYFDHEIKDLLHANRHLFRRNRTPEEDVLVKRLKLLLVGSVPIFVAGFLLEGFIAHHFYNLGLIGVCLIFTGTVLFSTMHLNPGRIRNADDVPYISSFKVGLAQAAAIFPGISRSGMTISAGMHLGISRLAATRLAVLLSIPAILGAAIYQLLSNDMVMAFDQATLVGTIVSAAVGYVAIRLLVHVLKRKKFHLFAYYCWALGALLIYLYLFP